MKRNYIEVKRCLTCWEDMPLTVESLSAQAVRVILETGLPSQLDTLRVVTERSYRLQCIKLCVEIPFSMYYGFPWIEPRSILDVLKLIKKCIHRRRILCGDLKLYQRTSVKKLKVSSHDNIYLKVSHVDTDIYDNKLV